MRLFRFIAGLLVALALAAPLSVPAFATWQFANRAWMTSATTGTGTMTLGTAQPGYLTLAQAGVTSGNTVTYVITDGNNFEVGRGTYTSAGTTLSRDTVLISLISGTSGTTKLTLSGTETVYLTPAAEDMLSTNNAVTVAQGGTGITSGTSGGVPYFSGSTTIASSGALSANQLVLGGGAGAAPTSLAAGTTTTLLHGNAAGAPSFSGVSLANDTAANQGTTTTLLHGNAAGQPSFGSVVSNDMNITTTSCTNQFVTAISAGGVGTCTTDTLASAQHANQGTTTTVLHGNAAGNPSFGSVALGSDISGTLGIGNGGTAQTTALAARGSAGLDVEAGTGHGDSIYTILATDRFVYTNAAFTASRTWTLPAANAVNAGGTICVGDQQGTVTASNTLVISRAGTDTINGGTTYTLNAANQGVCLISDGSSKWNVRNIPATELPAFTGDATTSAGSSALTLASVYGGSSPVGGATAVPVLTINAKGLITGTSTATPTVTAVNGISWPASGTSGGVPYFSSTSAISSSGALSANQIVLGGGAGAAPTSLGAGTTTTVLHGNAAGAPTFAGVSLANDTAANQGTTTTVLHGNAAGQPSFAGVSLTNDAAANQGTTTTLLHGNAAGQPSFAGVSLTSDASANQGTTTNVLHGNAAGQPSFGSVVSGDLNITSTTCTNQFVTAISASAAGTCTTDTLASAQHANQGTTTTVLHGNAAGNPSFGAVNLTNDVTGTLAAGSFATAPGIITPSMLNNGAGLSVLGVTGSSSAARADITGTANQVLQVNSAGTSLIFAAAPASPLLNAAIHALAGGM